MVPAYPVPLGHKPLACLVMLFRVVMSVNREAPAPSWREFPARGPGTSRTAAASHQTLGPGAQVAVAPDEMLPSASLPGSSLLAGPRPLTFPGTHTGVPHTSVS